MAVLDETDSGLDIDALRVVSEGVNALAGPEMGMLLITHYQRLLNHIKPHFVHIMMDGRIVKEGGPELAHELEAKGYETLRAEFAAASRPQRGQGAESNGCRTTGTKAQVDIGEYQYGFHDKEDYFFKSKRGLIGETVLEISKMKGEPEWMLEFRLKAYDHFLKRPMPNWGGDLSGIDFDNIFYYIRPSEKQAKPGTRCRNTSRTPSSGWAFPRRSASSWPGWRPIRVRGDLPLAAEDLPGAGRDLPGHGCRRARVPELVEQYFVW